MKYATILAALAAAAFATEHKLEKKQAGSYNSGSALQVLATALPSSILALAYTNAGAASSIIASEFRAGETPRWFYALPSDIKTNLLNGAATSRAATSSIRAMSYVSATPTPRPSVGNAMPYGTNGTMAGVAGGTGAVGPTAPGFRSSASAPSGSSTMGSTSGSATSTGGSGGSAQTTAPANVAAALPTAAISMGIAGAVGLMGILAL